MAEVPLITALTFTPLLGAVLVAGLDPHQKRLAHGLGLVLNFLALALAVGLWRRFDVSSPELQFVERHAWMPSLGVDYFVGVDGLGLLMVLLTALVVPFALLASGGGARKQMLPSTSEILPRHGTQSERAEGPASPAVPEDVGTHKIFVSLLLLLQAGLFGAFTALNFVHWFIFWELSLVPAYFLIRLRGGPRRGEAATQFFLYTMVGSVTMLLGFLAVYLATGTFDFIQLAEKGRTGGLASLFSVRLGWYELSTRALALVIFGGIFLGFAVKVPLVPFHTWLPAAYAEAPTPVTMLLTGVMSKLGVYGFLRVLLPIFPEQMRWVLTPLLWLAVATVVMSAAAALAQRDLKRLLAYSSVNHLGYCLLGIFAAAQITDPAPRWGLERTAALNGVLLQMFNHGVVAAAVFYFVGLIESRTARRGLDDFGGLRKVAPVFCGLMGISLFASLGLPGLNGFVGEFLIFKGAFALARWAAALSVIGLLATAIFLLSVLQRVWNGPLEPRWNGFADLTLSERLIVAPAVALMFVLGVWPQLLIGRFNATVTQISEGLRFQTGN